MDYQKDCKKTSRNFFSPLSSPTPPGVSFGNPSRVTVLNYKSYTSTGAEYSNVSQNKANFNSKKQTDISKKLEEKSYSEIRNSEIPYSAINKRKFLIRP